MNQSLHPYKVWDLPTRLCHWALVLLLMAQWASGQFGLLPISSHLWLGYALLVVIVFRILWGFVGSDSARFSHFLRGPAAVRAYLGRLGSDQPTRWPGHNPVGGWSTVLLLALALVQAVTGLFAERWGVLAGPLVETVSRGTVRSLTDLHGLLHWLLMVVVLAHIAAAVWYRWHKGEDRIGPIFGRGRIDLPDAPVLRFAGTLRALVVLALSLALVAAIAARAAP
ncbi:MAG: cytochrome b/b6 domain-containing protein [Xanthomonadales bacterium]|nr:cytochrome b/b6 domain-containing protein [Xanthomonadales bacterium]